MSLSQQRKNRCIQIIHDLMSRSISKIFAEPVDPILDNCENYFNIIHKPMDLGTVLRNLETDKYKRYSEFKSDMELIWNNALKYNGPDSQITVLAWQLKAWFDEMTYLMSDNELDDWITKLADIQQQISFYIQRCNTPKDKTEPIQKSKNAKKRKPPPREQEDPHDTAKTKKTKRSQIRKMSYYETEEITKQINGLEDEDTILKVLAIIKKEEPDLNANESSEINMMKLSSSTRFKIQDYLHSIE